MKSLPQSLIVGFLVAVTPQCATGEATAPAAQAKHAAPSAEQRVEAVTASASEAEVKSEPAQDADAKTASKKPEFGGTIQLRSESPDFRTLAMQTAKSSMYFFAGILILFGILKKLKKGPVVPAGQITIVSRTALSPKSALVVVSVRDREFFLSVSGDNIRLISSLDAQDALGETDYEDYFEDSDIESKYSRKN